MSTKYMLFFIILVLTTFLSMSVFAADVTLSWDLASGAEYYEIQMSTDLGVIWSDPRIANDTNSPTIFIWTGAPDSGLLLFRATSVSAIGKAIRLNAGAWYNGDWKMPDYPTGTGIYEVQ